MSDDPIRLVDVRAVLHIIGNAFDDSADFTSADYVRIRRQVEALPSVDAVPVVRCEKCTYSKPLNAVVIKCARCAEARLKTDYCSYGKRKDGDHHEG